MILKQFVLGAIEDNNYLLIDEKTKEAVLIDCTEESQQIDNAIKEYGATLKYILLTHGHFDHVLGVNSFRAKYHCKALIHEDDKFLLDKMKDFARSFGIPSVEIQNVDGFIKDGEVIEFGTNKIKVIHTPGHTKGGVCFLLEDKIFTGDTLFCDAIGRTDLPGGSFQQLKSSIEQRLFTLDENITVYPGHGNSTTIGHEKKYNHEL
ncbi:MAG: MBL fold metallo-hydrolase [Candidatus Gastranaerophilales bacterium]|nr:MBL fold metallo-hydrolase [Candidatus Gastranaerophilales bacterium]